MIVIEHIQVCLRVDQSNCWFYDDGKGTDVISHKSDVEWSVTELVGLID